MRLDSKTWKKISHLFGDGFEAEFDYHDKHRVGKVYTVGDGPNGPLVTLKFSDKTFKSFSLKKMKGFVLRTPVNIK